MAMGKWGWRDAISGVRGRQKGAGGLREVFRDPLGTTLRSLGWAGPVMEEFRRGAHLGMVELGFGPSAL